jgi:nucleoside-diphosphate-sugar epimerase
MLAQSPAVILRFREWMPMPVLITGGSGYFGSLLLRRLLDRGESCRIFDLYDASDRPPEVELVQGDIRDYPDILRACEDVDVIHHNVAQVPLAKNRRLFESVNIQGTESLLKAARAAGVKKVVYTSSSAVFGMPLTNPVTKQTPPKPDEAYGRAKYAGEKVCQEYINKGLDVTIIRPRTILGHGRLGIFQILFEWICTGFNVPVLGPGDNVYQFVHADDLAEACILAGERASPAVYNCGTDRFGTMREALEALCKHAGTGSTVKSVPMVPAVWAMKLTSAIGLSPLGPYHSLMYGRPFHFDITKAKTELGWHPQYSNVEMLIESYEWYLQNRGKVLAGAGGSHHRSAVRHGILGLVKWLL